MLKMIKILIILLLSITTAKADVTAQITSSGYDSATKHLWAEGTMTWVTCETACNSLQYRGSDVTLYLITNIGSSGISTGSIVGSNAGFGICPGYFNNRTATINDCMVNFKATTGGGVNVPVRWELYTPSTTTSLVCGGVGWAVVNSSAVLPGSNCSTAPPVTSKSCSITSALDFAFGSLLSTNYAGSSLKQNLLVTCDSDASVSLYMIDGRSISLSNNTTATLTINNVNAQLVTVSVPVLAGTTSIPVSVVLSGTPTAGEFHGSTTLVMSYN